jgi:DNA-binding PadR family transcriptional regulator
MAKSDHLGEFELIIMLAVIRLRESAYGVPVCREIEEKTGRDVTFGTVYTTLERLQRKGFIRSELRDPTPERGGRAKRYFSATASGLQEVRQTRRALMELWHGLPELEGALG